jgi:cation/acetate symporter
MMFGSTPRVMGVSGVTGRSIVRALMLAALLAVSILAGPQLANAQPANAQYPARPILLVVPYSAGSDADLAARNLAQHAPRFLDGQTLVVMNQPGASGAVGTLAVRNAAPDGYHLLLTRIASQVILPAMDTKTPYRWDDFTFLSVLELNPYVCAVRGNAPYASMKDLLAEIGKQPGKLNFATVGEGTIQNFGPQYLFSLAGLPKDAAVGVPYKGSGEFGCYTVPDFVGTRYGGNAARLLAVIVLTVASFTYVTAQINATGTIASVALDIPFQYAVYVGLISILLCSMLGGMRGVTWTQVAQYIVLIIAYLLPVFWISNKIGAGFFPHFMLADEVARIGELEQQFGFIKNSAADLATVPKGLAGITQAHSTVNATPWAFISLALAMMMGTASLPHVMMRFFTTPSVKAARKSVGWSVFFIFLLYSSAPMLATLSKLALIDPNLPTGIIGKSIAEVQAIDWYQNWNSANLMFVSDFNGNGTVELNEFFMGGKAVVLATPEIAGLPYVISGLVAAGGLAAAMSTADGLILAIANAISHDVYYKMVDPKAETAKRLVVARVLLVVIGFAGATIAAMEIQGILGSVIWAFDFAMSGLFWPLVLGVWWKRANKEGAIAGMALGLISGFAYLIWVRNGGSGFLGITQLTFGIFGSTVSLVAMIVVSLMTSEPSAATQKMVDESRVPAGNAVIGGQK